MESATKSWWFQDLFQLVCRLPVFMAVKNWQLREQLWQKQLEINTSSFSPSKVDTVGRPRDVGTVKGSSMALMMRHGVRTWGAKSTFSGMIFHSTYQTFPRKKNLLAYRDSHNGSWAGVIPTTKGSITLYVTQTQKLFWLVKWMQTHFKYVRGKPWKTTVASERETSSQEST